MKIVTAAIIRNDDKILIARRKKGQKLEGFWEFPGGKIEEGESPQECLQRELHEEFGIESKAGKILTESEYHYDHGSIRLLALETEILNGEIELTVHDEIVWATAEDLLDYKLAPADIPIAEEWIQNVW